MRVQLLPSTFDSQGHATSEQRLTCFLIDECVAVDAGSIALALTAEQRDSVRDIIVTHPHMDHIASLPIFIDDLFETLKSPVRVYATQEVIELLERDIFNWNVYPRFSELKNEYGPVMEYVPIPDRKEFKIAHLTAEAVAVNHIVPTVGLVVSDGKSTVAFSSDTSETDELWNLINRQPRIDALLIETSFPDSMAKLAEVSRHFTPASLQRDLRKLHQNGLDILAVHIKPAYRQMIIDELNALNVPGLGVMEPGRTYTWNESTPDSKTPFSISILWEKDEVLLKRLKQSEKYSRYSLADLERMLESIQAQFDSMDDSTGHLAGPLYAEQAELMEEVERRRGPRKG